MTKVQDEVQLLPKELDLKSGELHPPLGFPGFSSQIQLVRSIRALCGLLRTPPGLAMPVHDGLNDFSPSSRLHSPKQLDEKC